MPKIPIVLSETWYKVGLRRYLEWDTDAAPHVAISGITGTGKTYLVKLLLARISKHISEATLTVCDFKGDKDFSFLKASKRFYRFAECLNGFNQFYEHFLQTQKSGMAEGFHLLLFDEWASFLNFLDKKEAEEAKKKLSSLLMLGRSFDFHIMLSQQRLDAESFAKSRDNFNLQILLGNPSKEVAGMLFNDYKDQLSNDRTRGTGYMLTNGTDFQKIIVPTISNMETVNHYIYQGVNG